MDILKFNQYSLQESMLSDFITFLTESKLNESSEETIKYKEILKNTFKDLKLNLSFIGTFATGIAIMSPIVKELISNSRINIELTPQNVILLTVTAFSIIYLEERKNKNIKSGLNINEEAFKKDVKSLLEELKLRGMGNGIVKLTVSCFKSILNITNIIFKNIGNVISGFLDIFAYTALFIPIINSIMSLVGKYDLDLVTLPKNFLSLGVGITTLLAKNGIKFLIDILSDKLKIKKDNIMNKLNIAPYKKYPHPEFIDMEDEDLDGVDPINEDDR